MVTLQIKPGKTTRDTWERGDIFIVLTKPSPHRCLIQEVYSDSFRIAILDSSGKILHKNKGISFEKLQLFQTVYLGSCIKGERT